MNETEDGAMELIVTNRSEDQSFKQIFTFDNFKLMIDQIAQLKEDNEHAKEVNAILRMDNLNLRERT